MQLENGNMKSILLLSFLNIKIKVDMIVQSRFVNLAEKAMVFDRGQNVLTLVELCSQVREVEEDHSTSVKYDWTEDFVILQSNCEESILANISGNKTKWR